MCTTFSAGKCGNAFLTLVPNPQNNFLPSGSEPAFTKKNCIKLFRLEKIKYAENVNTKFVGSFSLHGLEFLGIQSKMGGIPKK